jgi:hypothetical protein
MTAFRRLTILVVIVLASAYGFVVLRGPQGIPALLEKHREIRSLEEGNAALKQPFSSGAKFRNGGTASLARDRCADAAGRRSARTRRRRSAVALHDLLALLRAPASAPRRCSGGWCR